MTVKYLRLNLLHAKIGEHLAFFSSWANAMHLNKCPAPIFSEASHRINILFFAFKIFFFHRLNQALISYNISIYFGNFWIFV